MKSGMESGSVTLFSLIKTEHIYYFIWRYWILYVNCISGSNITMDIILGHHCSETIPSKPIFCSILMGKLDSIWYVLPWITHFSKVSKLSLREATIEYYTISASIFFFLRKKSLFCIFQDFFCTIQVFIINLFCARYSTGF